MNEITIEFNKYQYFQDTLDIARYILNVYNAKPEVLELFNTLNNAITYGTNPNFNVLQSYSSLLLEYYYGMPNKFHTPLGELDFANGGYSKTKNEVIKVHEVIVSKLGLVEVKPQTCSEWGCFGPVYAITKNVNGETVFTLPASPIKYLQRIDYTSRLPHFFTSARCKSGCVG